MEPKTHRSYVQADNPIPERAGVMSGMSNQNTFPQGLALKETDQRMCSLPSTNFSQLTDTYSQVCRCSACG